MHPTEEAFISSYARGVIANVIISLASTVFYGFYLLLLPWSAAILYRRRGSKATYAMFALTLVSFMTTTAHWVSMAILNTTLLRVGFVDLPGSDIIAQFQKAQLQVSWIFTFDVWPQTVVFIINDTILVWRVHCMFSHNIWVKGGTSMLLIASIATGLAESILATVGGDSASRNDLSGILATPHLQLAYWILSLITNVVSTGLIGFIAWQHRQMLSESRQSSPIQKIFILLVETGVAFIAIQVTMIALSSTSLEALTTADMVSDVITNVILYCAAIVPTLVLVIVSEQRSVVDATSGNPMSTFRAGRGEGSSLTQLTFTSFASSAPENSSQIEAKDEEPIDDYIVQIEEQVRRAEEGHRLWTKMPSMTGTGI